MSDATSVLDHRPAHIDPRIRARRLDVQRGAARRRLQRLVDVGLVLAVAAGFVVALRTPLLDVEEVQVSGNVHASAALVVERSGIHRGDQLVDLDLRAAGERVAEIPWVDEVILHRGLDGRVALRVTERTAVAVAGTGAAAVLVDGEGRALARGDEEPALTASLPRLGDDATGPEPGRYLSGDAAGPLTLAERLAGAGVASGLVLAETPEGGLTARLPDGAEVRFGVGTQLEAKVQALVTVLEQVDLRCAATIDVRYPPSVVLTRVEGCS